MTTLQPQTLLPALDPGAWLIRRTSLCNKLYHSAHISFMGSC